MTVFAILAASALAFTGITLKDENGLEEKLAYAASATWFVTAVVSFLA